MGTEVIERTKGPRGPAGTMEVGSTSTLSPGEDATVTNSGTSTEATFDFGIPTGPQAPPMSFRGTWDNTVTYSQSDAVVHDAGSGERLWGANQDTNAGDEPGTSAKWTDITDAFDSRYVNESGDTMTGALEWSLSSPDASDAPSTYASGITRVTVATSHGFPLTTGARGTLVTVLDVNDATDTDGIRGLQILTSTKYESDGTRYRLAQGDQWSAWQSWPIELPDGSNVASDDYSNWPPGWSMMQVSSTGDGWPGSDFGLVETFNVGDNVRTRQRFSDTTSPPRVFERRGAPGGWSAWRELS